MEMGCERSDQNGELMVGFQRSELVKNVDERTGSFQEGAKWKERSTEDSGSFYKSTGNKGGWTRRST